MNRTRLWILHMAAGVVLFLVLGLHMAIMHLGGVSHLFAPYAGAADSIQNSLFRDRMPFFTVSYVLLLGVALFHGLYGFRTILFELTLKRAAERAITVVLLVVGLGLFALGTWAAVAAHGMALAGVKG